MVGGKGVNAEWAVGLLGGLFLLVAGWLWNLNRDLTKNMSDLKSKVDTSMNVLDQRLTAQETKMGPLWKLCEEALPSILQIHKSPDLLREALDGDPDIEKIELAEAEVTRRQEEAEDPSEKFRLMFARWMLAVRRQEYYQIAKSVKKTEVEIPRQTSCHWWQRLLSKEGV